MVCGRGRTCCFHGWLWRRSCRPWRCDPGAYVCWQPLRAESCVSPCCAGKESKDHEKENVRRIKEIQKKCKERERAQERSQPKPVKALWKSQKYENVESKVKARLQVGSQGAPQLCCQGRRRKSHHGFCLPPPARPFCPRNPRAVLGVGRAALSVSLSRGASGCFSASHGWGSCPTGHCPPLFCTALGQRRRDQPSVFVPALGSLCGTRWVLPAVQLS